MPDEQHITSNKVTLVDLKGEKTLHIWADILPGGDLQISGQDLSKGLGEIFGDDVDEYEYWYRIPSEHKDRVLLLLLSAFYGGRMQGDGELKALLEKHSIPYKFTNYF